MKLETNMYVRFKDKRGNTYIRKITKLANEYPQKLYGMEIDIEANYSEYLSLKNVLKASHSIINLIQVGDYVNGQVVTEIIPENRKVKPSTMIYTGTNYYVGLYNEDIETVVTKEQFESMSYKVGE